ncbi:MAG: zinc ribbon domain-containing protein [Chloroflexi bacterium]|nr:zinc ribbon domain-containing protein [Chloroflexota bacterium]MDA1145625.1 zinc ribbon domain-containing protein [Chloroflexota bacterium]
MIFCTACGSEADDQALFCDHCGTQLVAALPRVCTECGRRNRTSASFCNACGTSLQAAPAAAVALTTPPLTVSPTRVEPSLPPEVPSAPAASAPTPASAPAPPPPVEAAPSRPPPTPESATLEPIAAALESAVPAVEAPTGTPGPDPSAAPPPSRPHRESDPATRARRPGPPPPPSRSAAESAREWAASRQADILLYLGAFLLVAAALLFVSSQGNELSSELRVSLLLVYTVAFTVAGLLARRTTRIREAGAVFLAIGALITPLNFLLIYTEILEQRDVSPDLVWLIGSLYSALFYALLWSRGYGKLYAVPAGLSIVSAWAALAAVVDLPAEWFGTWWIGFLVIASAVAVRVRYYGTEVAAVLGALIALVLLGELIASDLFLGDHGAVPLPFSFALITAWFALTGWSLRQPLLLPWGATSAIAIGIAAVRALGLAEDWGAYSPLAMGFVAVYSRRWWARWNLSIARLGWPYAAGCALTPLALIGAYDTSAHGAVSFLVGAAVLASVAWRDTTDGVRLLDEVPRGTPTTVAERTVFAWLGFISLLIGVGYTQRELGIAAQNTGWSYLAIGLVTIALLARTGRRWNPALAVFAPPAILAMLVSLADPGEYPGHVAVLLGVPALAFLASFAITRRWGTTLVSAAIAVFAVAAAWDALGWTPWTLAVAYSLAGTALFASLTPLRSYRPRSTPTIVAILSWSYLLIGPIVAFGEVLSGESGAFSVELPAYRAGLYLLLLLAPPLAYEGWRFHNWSVTAAATTLAALVIAPLWNSYGWPAWTLSLTYLGVGVVRFATMTAVRTYARDWRQIPIVFLSWGLTLAAPITAWIALADRMASDGGAAVEMVEYRAFIVGVLAPAPLLLFEARRLRARWALVSSSVVAMAALLLTIAVFRFDSVHAYTVPVGLDLIAFGLIVRRSAVMIERHLMLHEAVLLLGVAIMLVPQAAEGVQPEGAAWGGVVLVEGIVFLLVGMVLGSRWLTVGGVLAVSGVAIRWLADSTGDTIPYWLSLGGVGMGLLVLGTVLLLARDRWIVIKNATVTWWRRSATLRGVGIEWPVVAAPAAVIVIALLVASIEDWVRRVA